MTANQKRRIQQILDHLRGEQELVVDEASRLFDVSPATIRRDFTVLAEQGKVEKTWGGVRPRAEHSRAPDVMPSYWSRGVRFPREKQRIAEKAASLVSDGDVLMIDGGTSTFHMAAHLAERPVRILTNSLAIAQEIDRRKGRRRGAEVFVTGGLLYPESNLVAGPQAEAFIRNYHAAWAFLSVGGIDANGATNNNELVLGSEQAMIAQSHTAVLLADHSKLGPRAMCRVCPLDAIDILITDAWEENRPLLGQIDAAGVRVVEV